ncbi:MAG: methyltransferase [Hyphococcus sp.]|nr:MAG: methyltransferase [Marinicaulis sp.]
MNIQDNVKDYYGKQLQSSADLKTDACCTVDDMPRFLGPVLTNIHPDVSNRYYGCGLIAPEALSGARILDLGCGAGRDVYALSQLVGAEGEVVGVDMTPEQLKVARQYQDWHAEKFGFANTAFLEGDIEKLDRLNLEPASFDIIVSNCVINLVEDKAAVFKAASNLLKPGGEFYFSDVYADRRLTDDLRHDPIAQGECLGGALYWNDFLAIAKQSGFHDPRLVTNRPLAINNDELREQLGDTAFYSATYRLFKVDKLEQSNENYGQSVIYKGGILNRETVFTFDKDNVFNAGETRAVSGNTFLMLQQSRFATHFEFIGDRSTHYGLFASDSHELPFSDIAATAQTSSKCC